MAKIKKELLDKIRNYINLISIIFNEKIYQILGLIYYNQKEYDRAIEYFEKSIEI